MTRTPDQWALVTIASCAPRTTRCKRCAAPIGMPHHIDHHNGGPPHWSCISADEALELIEHYAKELRAAGLPPDRVFGVDAAVFTVRSIYQQLRSLHNMNLEVR